MHITGRTAHGPGSLEAAAAAVVAAGGECVTHVVDHSDASAIGALFDQVMADEPEGVDLLVNNVYPAVVLLGDALRSGATKFWQQPPTAFADINDVGLTAHYVASVHYAKAMVPRGRGLIVTVSSPAGCFYFFTAAYSTGKAAVDRMTKDFAHELHGTGLGAFVLYPGTCHSSGPRPLVLLCRRPRPVPLRSRVAPPLSLAQAWWPPRSFSSLPRRG